MIKRRALLVNPWITDVAAFDLWARPLGLLYWAARLRQWGFEVGLVDCTDRAHPALRGASPASRDFHTGKYYAEPLEPCPEPARRAKRVFRRYGLPREAFEGELEAFERAAGGAPDVILVASRMTYWYHGVAEAVAMCRRRWSGSGTGEAPRVVAEEAGKEVGAGTFGDGGANGGSGTPAILLGGTYATLAPGHARAHSGADVVFEGEALEELPRFLRERFPDMSGRIETPSPDPETWPRPAFDLCHDHGFLPLLTSVGCPFDCSYCAAPRLARGFRRRSAESVFREARDCHRRWGTEDFAFYDDALLVDSARYFEPFLDRIIAEEMPVRFHTPNGLHYGAIDANLARKMKAAGVETVRLSLESSEPGRLKKWNRRGDNEVFVRAVGALRDAGYERRQIGAYILAGMPGQAPGEVRRAIELVRDAGATPKLNEYSPIPGTPLWDEAVRLSGGEIAAEPLWQNNSLYYTRPEVFPRRDFEELKMLAREA